MAEKFTVSFCGFDTYNPDGDVIYRPKGLGKYLFLLILAPMEFTFPDGHKELAEAGACLLYTPTTFQHYRAPQTFFNSYVEFASDLPLEDIYHLPYNQLFYPSNTAGLNHLLQKIYQEYVNHLPHSTTLLANYLEELFITLERSGHTQHFIQENAELYPRFLSTRLMMLSRCEKQWTAELLCTKLALGKSQFYKLYKEFFNATPNEELTQARLQKFLYLLTNDALSIKQAAYQAGFQNIQHFNRLFKKYYHCSPKEYRQRKILL